MIPLFIQSIEDGSDVVIGSRYIVGGGTPDWNIRRRSASKVGNILARKILGLNDIKDCTSGYRAIKTEILKKINLDNLDAKGYAFQISLLNEFTKLRAKIKEIPLVFYDRKHGKTKLGSGDILEFAINIFKLRMSKRD
jgi:dolichol-phosphate mannosyltransferase